MGWNYLSIPKLQRCNRWSLGMDKLFHPTLYMACDYVSMLGLKLNHVSKRGYRWRHRFQSKLVQVIICPVSDSTPQLDSMLHYSDVIMVKMASQITTSLMIVYYTIYPGADQRKHESSASLAFVRGIHQWPVNSRTKSQLRGKCFHLMSSSWIHNQLDHQ